MGNITRQQGLEKRRLPPGLFGMASRNRINHSKAPPLTGRPELNIAVATGARCPNSGFPNDRIVALTKQQGCCRRQLHSGKNSNFSEGLRRLSRVSAEVGSRQITSFGLPDVNALGGRDALAVFWPMDKAR